MIVITARKEPTPIRAVQWDGTPKNALEIEEWSSGAARYKQDKQEITVVNQQGVVYEQTNTPARLVINTLEGDMETQPGDYVIRGTANEYYPCKKEIFEQNYTVLTEESTLF